MTDYNRLSQFSAPVAQGEVVNHLAPLPAGHPSNALMWLRDQIPAIQADDTSTASGIYSRLGRTLTGIPRAGLETMANWLEGTHNPEAIKIGQDTAAPLGLFGMAGLAGRGVSAAAMADNAKSSVPGTVANAAGERRPTFNTLEEARAWDQAQAEKLWASVKDRKRDESTPEAKKYRAEQEAEIARLMELAKRPYFDGTRADPLASSPGLAANATQEDGVMGILRKYGLLEQ